MNYLFENFNQRLLLINWLIPVMAYFKLSQRVVHLFN